MMVSLTIGLTIAAYSYRAERERWDEMIVKMKLYLALGKFNFNINHQLRKPVRMVI